LSNGEVIHYQSLITTIPLDITLNLLGRQEWAQGLQHCSTHIIGVGIRGQRRVLLGFSDTSFCNKLMPFMFLCALIIPQCCHGVQLIRHDCSL